MGQKRTGAKMSKVSKITLFMLVDLTNEFLKYVLYLQTFLPGLLPHCNLTYMTSEKNYLTSSISFDMSYLKIIFQTQFSGTSNTLVHIVIECFPRPRHVCPTEVLLCNFSRPCSVPSLSPSTKRNKSLRKRLNVFQSCYYK